MNINRIHTLILGIALGAALGAAITTIAWKNPVAPDRSIPNTISDQELNALLRLGFQLSKDKFTLSHSAGIEFKVYCQPVRIMCLQRANSNAGKYLEKEFAKYAPYTASNWEVALIMNGLPGQAPLAPPGLYNSWPYIRPEL